jgi:hypothetical protein
MSNSYEVGYGKPPKASQFKSGESGNTKGRPKGTKNLKTELEEELQEKILITEDGKRKKVSKRRAMIKSLMVKALQGDTKAANTIISMNLKFSVSDVEQTEDLDLSSSDQALLDDYISTFLSTPKPKKKVKSNEK